MTRLVIDDAIAQTLEQANGCLEICNGSGRVLGYFAPAEPREVSESLDSPASDEELRKRLREGGGRPLADILRDLEKGS